MRLLEFALDGIEDLDQNVKSIQSGWVLAKEIIKGCRKIDSKSKENINNPRDLIEYYVDILTNMQIRAYINDHQKDVFSFGVRLYFALNPRHRKFMDEFYK